MTYIFKIDFNKVVYEIILFDKKVYMEVRKTNYLNDKRFVVIVDSVKFLELWRNEPYPQDRKLNFGDETIWKNDRKFKDAENGFSFGIGYPVPLANIVCYNNEKNNQPYIAINDGITRTIWLLANKAKSFPIECHSIEEAKLVASFASINNEINSVAELLNC